VPIIVATTSAPAFAAASQVRTVNLAFDKSSYSVNGCSSISGVKITATINTVPQAGVSVSVSLPDGYAYSNGATTYSGVTDTNGVVTLPNISTPGSGGTTVLTAVAAASSTTSGATASSNIAVSANVVAAVASASTSGSGITAVPSDAQPLGGGYFLASNGDLYNQATKVATGAISARVYSSPSATLVSFNTNSGGSRISGSTVAENYSGVPTNATSVGADYYLTTGGDLYYKGSKVASSVQSAAGSFRDSHYAAEYISANNELFVLYEGVQQGSAFSFPSESNTPVRPLGSGFFLTGSGDLYFQSTKMASGVVSAFVQGRYYENEVCYFNDAAGMKVANTGGVIEAYAGVPNDAVAVGAAYFLRPTGQLYFRNNVVATGVATASGDWDNGYYKVAYVLPTGVAYRYAVADGSFNPSTAGQTSGPNLTQNVPVLSYPTPLGSGFFLTGSGDLYFQNSKMATGVLSAFVQGRYYENEVCYFNDASNVYVANNGGVIETYAGIPVDAVAVGAAYFLRPSGELYFRNTVVATGVAKAAGDWDNGSYRVTYVTSAGVAYRYAVADGSFNPSAAGQTSGPDLIANVPASSTPVGHAFLLAPSGDLYYGSRKIASGIASASGWALNTWRAQACMVGTNGVAQMFLDDGSFHTTTLTTNFSGAKALVAGYFLKPDGSLYYQDSQVATGVQVAQGNIKDTPIASIVLKTGVSEQAVGASVSGTFPSVPVRPVPVGHAFLLAPSGDLYYGSTKIASGIASASGWALNTWRAQACMVGTNGVAQMFLDDGSFHTTTLTTNFTRAVALVAGYFLRPDGSLYYQDSQVTTGVQTAQGNIKDTAIASIVLTNGLAQQAVGASVNATFTVVSNRPAALGGGFCLTPGGNLYYVSSKVLSGVRKASGWCAAGTPTSTALGTDGKVRQVKWVNGSASTTTYTTDFSGAFVLRGGYVLSSTGALYLGDTAVDSKVITAQGDAGTTSSASYTKYAC